MFIKVVQKSLGQIKPGQILHGQISLRKSIGGGRRCWLYSVKLWLKSRFIFTIYLFGGKKCTYFLKKVLITKSTYLLQFCSRNPGHGQASLQLHTYVHQEKIFSRTQEIQSNKVPRMSLFRDLFAAPRILLDLKYRLHSHGHNSFCSEKR